MSLIDKREFYQNAKQTDDHNTRLPLLPPNDVLRNWMTRRSAVLRKARLRRNAISFVLRLFYGITQKSRWPRSASAFPNRATTNSQGRIAPSAKRQRPASVRNWDRGPHKPYPEIYLNSPFSITGQCLLRGAWYIFPEGHFCKISSVVSPPFKQRSPSAVSLTQFSSRW